MNKIKNIQDDDEIELFEMLQTLWDGKWIISSTVAISILLGCCYLFLKDAVYESKLYYSIDNLPPFYEQNKVAGDFKKNFYTKSRFEDWKKSYSNASLVFEDFSATEVVDGFVLSKGKNKQLARMGKVRKGPYYIIFKTNKLNILDEFFKYANHVNRRLTEEYIVRATDELKIIEKRFKEIDSQDSAILDAILSLDRYTVSADKGASVFNIQRPGIPRKISQKSSVTIILSAILGLMGGVFYMIINNVLKKRKQQFDKT